MPHPAPSTLAALLLTLSIGLLGCEDDPNRAPPDAEPPDVAPLDTEPDAEPDAGPPEPALDPASGPMSGYFPVALDLAEQPFDGDMIQRIELGGIAAVGLTPDGDTLHFIVQGHPEPGPVDLVIETADGRRVVPDAFTYHPPRIEGLLHVVAVGASISQGFQAGAIDTAGMLGSPPALVARQLGAFMPLPLFVDDLFPPFGPDRIDPPPLCQGPDATEWAARAVGTMVPRLAAADEDGVPLAAGGRLDAALEVSHLALSGSRIADTLDGPGIGGAGVLAHLAYEPYARIFDPLTASPLDRAEARAPDVLLAIDIYGNDVLFDEPAETMEEEQALRDALVADIERAIERMAATGAHVFVGDMPPSSVLPGWRLERATAIRDAEPGTEDAVAARLDADIRLTDERTALANAALYAAAERYDNVHPVPTAATVLALIDDPLQVGGETLTIEMFGGLIGLDTVHFTDTGSAIAANTVIETLNAALGVDVPLVDLGSIVADDPESPSAVRALGIPVDDCLR